MEKLNKNIIFVAGLHGNEKMPVKSLTENGIDFILGSPKAYEQNVRYTAQDLNASFGLDDGSYESDRAKEVLNEISEDTLVVDFHTTEKEERPFVIIVDEKMRSLAERTGIADVVVMKHNIKKGHSLINYRNGISVEAGTHESRKSYETTLNVVKNLEENKVHPMILYEVYDVISKPGEYENFKEHKDGFIPILANESEYERHGIFGLKARKL